MVTQGDNNRGKKLFRKLIPGERFHQGIVRIRDLFSIPPRGLTNRIKIFRWYSTTYREKKKHFMVEINRFLRAQKLPQGSWWRQQVIKQVISNGEIDFLSPVHGAEPFVEIIDKTATKRGSSTDLRLYEGAKTRDVKGFVDRNWHIIEPSQRVGTHKNVRSESDPDFTDQAAEIYKRPKKELDLERGTKKGLITTKGALVSEIINGQRKQLGKTPKSITDDALKARIYRRKKSQR